MKIEKPIFIVGPGRSGTTILYKLLSIHPEVCWFSNYTDKYPGIRRLPILHKILDIPFIGNKVKQDIIKHNPSKFTIKPVEAANIYHSYCGFEHARRTTENDLRKEMEYKFKEIIEEHLRLTGKNRFLNKQTANTQRIRVINKMFRDAYYVHIIRDGRAVANSLSHVKWWKNVDIWWLGIKPPTWEQMGKDLIELCALHWKRGVEEILENKHLFENRYIEVRYERLVEDTKDSVRSITALCELNWSKGYEKLLPKTLPNMNHKWKEELTERQRLILNSSIGKFLIQLGYRL